MSVPRPLTWTCLHERQGAARGQPAAPRSRPWRVGEWLVGGERAKAEAEGEDAHQPAAQAYPPLPLSLLISQKEGCVLPQSPVNIHCLRAERLLRILGILQIQPA